VPKNKQYSPEIWFADTENPDAIAQMEDAGLPVMGANKDIVNGIEKVRPWLRTADGYVRLYITDNCVNTIAEFKSYRYPEGGGNRPIDKNNHLMDPLRYIFDTLDDIGSEGGGRIEVDVY
jgi:phage terminase large subunit